MPLAIPPLRRSACRTVVVLGLLLASLPALAGAREDVMAAMTRFLALKSYQATMQVDADTAGVSEVTFVAPDRYRIHSARLGTQSIIGNTLWLDLGGQLRKVPLPPGTLDRYRDPVRLASERDRLQVTDLGPSTVDGQPAHRYRMVRSEAPDAVTMLWIGRGGLPLRIEAASSKGRVTIRYARFNDPTLRVQAP
jgi:hypothetical protein